MTEKRGTYTAEFKHDALRLWNDGDRSARLVEKELGLSAGTLYRWKKQVAREGDEAFPGRGRLITSEEEIRQLKRELHRVKQERDILKKTISIFSTRDRSGTK